MPEYSFLTTSATTMNEPTSTTESLGEDIDRITTRDQTTTGFVLDKKNTIDLSVVIADSKLAIILSAMNLAMFLVSAVIILFVVLLVYIHKRKAKEQKSAEIKLTKMRELTMKLINPTPTLNAYTSPVYYCSEETVDLM